MTGTNVYDCLKCGPTAAWDGDLDGCPSCGEACELTSSHGARLEEWARVVGIVVGNLECVVTPRLAVDSDDLDQLAQLADWLHKEGGRQRQREDTPPLRLVGG